MWCSYDTTTTHSNAHCPTKRHKRNDGKSHIAAAGSFRVRGTFSAYDLPEEDDQPERPYISVTVTEIHPTAARTAEQSHKADTWPFCSLPASRPWPFEERAKPTISFGGQEKPDVSYMYGGTVGQCEPLFGMAPMKSEPAEIKRIPRGSGNVVTVLVESGASGHCSTISSC